MNPDPLPGYFKFDYRTFFNPEERALFKAYERELKHLHHMHDRTVRTGTHVMLKNQMQTWQMMHGSQFFNSPTIDGVATDEPAKGLGQATDSYFDFGRDADLGKQMFVYLWLKDMREKVYLSPLQIDYKPQIEYKTMKEKSITYSKDV